MPSLPNLGRLERVDLRNIWQRESEDFTPWLAQAENLQLLGETISIELELEAREQSVGPFRADILCKDTGTDQWVLIENQLERTDHSHLGQLLTYAAGLDAVTIVWVAEHFTEEHRATLDWLNEHTDDKINLFGLEIELWRIDTSPVAPKFNIVCKPNDWSRAVQIAAQSELSETKQQQLLFWTAFAEYLKAHHSTVKPRKPRLQHWMNHPIGRSDFHLASIASTGNGSEAGYGKPELRAELVLRRENAKQAFASLEARRQEIEAQAGKDFKWHNPKGKQMCRIYTRMDGDFRDQAQWHQQHEWLRQNLELLQRVFSPLIETL